MTLNEHHTASTDGSPLWHTVSLVLRKWVRLLLAGNPFYIASAALLLFGINRLSVDPRFLSGEEANLLFNFSALQLYELLLVAVALFLGARRIFYDSTLLVVLESIILLVPFVLVTHAAMIGKGLALVLCCFGAGLVVVRFSTLKFWFSELNLPGRSFFLLGLIVCLNGGIPLFFRETIESGGSDAWEGPYRLGWLLILPFLQALALLIPKSTEANHLPQSRPWLPFLFYTLWLAGTAVHLWCMGYVADRDFRFYLLTPLLWSFCWVVHCRIHDFGPRRSALFSTVALSAPVVALLPAAAAPDSRLFFVLASVNAVAFLWMRATRRTPGVGHLFLISFCMAIASLPVEWGTLYVPDFTRARCVAISMVAYALVRSAISARPGVGVCGAVMAGVVPVQLWPALSTHVSVQVGLAFLLLHSLRWDGNREGERLRIVTAATWIVHAFGWTYAGGTISGWTVSSAAVILLIIQVFFLYLGQGLRSRLIAIAAIVVLCAWPINRLVRLLETAPSGLLGVVASFVLLAAGTWLALARKSTRQNSGTVA